jgi:hypothetical protein
MLAAGPRCDHSPACRRTTSRAKKEPRRNRWICRAQAKRIILNTEEPMRASNAATAIVRALIASRTIVCVSCSSSSHSPTLACKFNSESRYQRQTWAPTPHVRERSTQASTPVRANTRASPACRQDRTSRRGRRPRQRQRPLRHRVSGSAVEARQETRAPAAVARRRARARCRRWRRPDRSAQPRHAGRHQPHGRGPIPHTCKDGIVCYRLFSKS